VRRQQGVSLLVVLILLLVMSLLGIAVLRSSAMQERMSANMVDRNEAVQAAETGLLVAQRVVIRGTFNAMWNGSTTFTALRTAAGMSCANGYCDRSDPTNAATWQTAPNTPAAWTTMPSTNHRTRSATDLEARYRMGCVRHVVSSTIHSGTPSRCTVGRAPMA